MVVATGRHAKWRRRAHAFYNWKIEVVEFRRKRNSAAGEKEKRKV